MRTLTEASRVLLAYSPPGMKGKCTLERMITLLKRLGNPQESLRSIHIGGTSGKTSTAYFVRGFLEAAGCKTGLTVSPHIVAVNERVQIGGQPFAESQFLDYLNEFLPLVEETAIRPTYFELLIAFAYWVFAREQVDYAVIETGLGGTLDGTNTIARKDKVCVLTNIGLDHTEILGGTLPEIAAQKAGIIQRGNHVLARAQADEIMRVFAASAAQKQADLEIITSLDAPSLLPEFQHQNWALARAVYEYTAARDGLPRLGGAQADTIAHQTPPGRGEIYRVGGKRVILDGAHNPQKLEALLHSLMQKDIASAAVLANFVESPDSKLRQSLALLAPFASHWIVPEFSAGQDLKSRHSFPAAHLVSEIDSNIVEAIPNPHEALNALLARPEATLLITGSLYLVSLLRPEILR